MLNKVILMGRLTKVPELKFTPSNVPVCAFSIAVDRRFAKQGEERKADFINIVTWRQTAEFVAKYFTKGQMINIVGNLQTRTYDKDNEKRYVMEVIAEEVNFCGDSKKSDVSENTESTEYDDGFIPLAEDEDDLPF